MHSPTAKIRVSHCNFKMGNLRQFFLRKTDVNAEVFFLRRIQTADDIRRLFRLAFGKNAQCKAIFKQITPLGFGKRDKDVFVIEPLVKLLLKERIMGISSQESEQMRQGSVM